MKTGKDLSKEAPVSPRKRVLGFALLPRTIEKCRALLWGSLGDYKYDCHFDNILFGWKGISGKALKEYIAEGHTDEEIALWVKAHGKPKTDKEIEKWSDELMTYDMAHIPESHLWLQGRNTAVGIPKNSPLVAMLEADDKLSFKK